MTPAQKGRSLVVVNVPLWIILEQEYAISNKDQQDTTQIHQVLFFLKGHAVFFGVGVLGWLMLFNKFLALYDLDYTM